MRLKTLLTELSSITFGIQCCLDDKDIIPEYANIWASDAITDVAEALADVWPQDKIETLSNYLMEYFDNEGFFCHEQCEDIFDIMAK